VLSRNKVGVSEAVAGDVALVAQLVEHLFYTQRVMGSSPIQSKFIIFYTHRLVVGRYPFTVKTWVQFPVGVYLKTHHLVVR
jgi:hypothetical protein